MKIASKFFLFFSLYQVAFACTTIIVGKNASSDHSIMIARNVDSITNKPVHFIYHPPINLMPKNFKVVDHSRSFDDRETSSTYHSLSNKFSYKMPSILYGYSGIPDPNAKSDKFFEEAGFNDLGVAISGTETIKANYETLKKDPYNKESGIKEDSIVSVLLPQIKSARDGVILLGQIIEKYGSGEGFGVAFADKHEAWYLENAGGHTWVAVRIPDDKYFVSANQGRIGVININDQQNVLGSGNLIKQSSKHLIAFERQWALKSIQVNIPPSYLTPVDNINFFKRYTANSAEDVTYNYYRVWSLQKLYTPSLKNNLSGNFPMFLKPDHLLTTAMVESGLRLYYKGTKYDPYTNSNPRTKYRPVAVFRTQESHILKLRGDNLPPPIANIVYLSLGMTPVSIYVPFYIGSDIPHEYQVGDFMADNISAFWHFRKLQVLVMHDFKDYAPIVESGYAKLSLQIAAEQKDFEKAYIMEYKQDPSKAKQLLDEFTHHIVAEVFAETDKLTNQIMTLDATKINQQYLFYGN